MREWPEGPAADPRAARERYDADLASGRAAAREALRADLRTAHFGAGVVLLVSVLAGFLVAPATGLLVAGAFAALFVVTLAVMLLRALPRTQALRRAYLFTFGWANWL
ncbi:hypothetical protein [Streptomyces sp. AcH 505]|uniref:hypothetical protein n=1 Tax=Streptomyces sp. AcH 505 TaxID=352211 RepID=UPI0006942C36